MKYLSSVDNENKWNLPHVLLFLENEKFAKYFFLNWLKKYCINRFQCDCHSNIYHLIQYPFKIFCLGNCERDKLPNNARWKPIK